jgi:dTMP kinase
VIPAGQGRFITLEGGEGAGKSTQIKLLADRLRACGKTVVTTREPGGSPGAEAIRALLVSGATNRWEPMTEALLHYAARHDHLVRTVRPALASGAWVISDRFADSTAVYQGVGQGVEPQAIRQLHALVAGTFAPDLTLILDMDPAVGLARAKAWGGEDRYERMGPVFHAALRAGFLAIAQREPSRCAVVDADADPATVGERIWAVVAERLAIPP